MRAGHLARRFQGPGCASLSSVVSYFETVMKREEFKEPEFKRSQAIKSFRIAGRDFPRVACGYERGDYDEAIGDDCSNCGVPTGFLHMLPCDLEQCPRCQAQALSCGCTYEKRQDEI